MPTYCVRGHCFYKDNDYQIVSFQKRHSIAVYRNVDDILQK